MKDSALEQTFTAFLQQHQKIIFKVCHTYCAYAEERDDLAQEIALQWWRAFPTYDPTKKASTWAYRIALNVAISYHRSLSRKKSRQQPLEDRFIGLAEDKGSEELEARIQQLRRIINQWDDLNKAIILLYLEGHSYQEIADMAGISPSNVGTKINRLKEKLKTTFAAPNSKK
ncbi:MAG: sigma-70 family RNA polymerase sigma factor [Bacteroidota bacterium]